MQRPPEKLTLWPLHDPSSVGTQSRDQPSLLRVELGDFFCLIYRNTYQETEAHKAVLLGDLQTDYKLLGTIKAFSYFWLPMLVTHKYIQTSFFSPFEQFFTLFLFSFTKQTPIALLGNSKEKWGGSRW